MTIMAMKVSTMINNDKEKITIEIKSPDRGHRRGNSYKLRENTTIKQRTPAPTHLEFRREKIYLQRCKFIGLPVYCKLDVALP